MKESRLSFFHRLAWLVGAVFFVSVMPTPVSRVAATAALLLVPSTVLLIVIGLKELSIWRALLLTWPAILADQPDWLRKRSST